MLAAKHNADSVVTIETFSPVSQFARKIIDENGFKDKIKLINKHSTEVKVGESEEMKQKANILVAEVLDTELIGEGAIKTYNQAHSNLLEDDCVAVPHKANVYVQIVKSSLASSWHEFKEMKIDENFIIKSPDDVSNFPTTFLNSKIFEPIHLNLFRPLKIKFLYFFKLGHRL